MSKMVVIAYETADKAVEVRSKLRRLQKEQAIDIDEMLVAIKDDDGEVSLLQSYKALPAAGSTHGFWNTLVGLVLVNPALSMARLQNPSAVSGALAEVGVDEGFVTDLAASFLSGSSVLFCLIRDAAAPERVFAELRGTGGRVLETTLNHEEEERLQVALRAAS